MNGRAKTSEYVVCVDNRGFKSSLIVRKIYEAIADETATAHQMVRIVDESAEDYLFPNRLFLPIDVPANVRAKWGPARPARAKAARTGAKRNQLAVGKAPEQQRPARARRSPRASHRPSRPR